MVLGTPHCKANCIVMNAMEQFYPKQVVEFKEMVSAGVKIPSGFCDGLSDSQLNDLYNATIIHEKPLTNALGKDFKKH